MPDPVPAPRVLVRASERGEPSGPHAHPYNPRSEIHGWTISRMAGLARVAVNLAWVPAGKETAIYHRHHREEEWVYVLEGRGVIELEDAEHPVGPGDFAAFPPGVAHHLRNTGDERLLILEGGEIIPDVEVADFPRLGRRLVRYGNRFAVYPFDAEVEFFPGMKEAPPEWYGAGAAVDASRLVVPAGGRPPARTFHHPQNPRAEVALTWLSRPALKRVSAGVAAVPPGREAFVHHVHRHDEEWMYVLSGKGTAVLGARREEIGPGDFLGFPAGGEPHSTIAGAGEPLVYLQGGDAWSKDTIEIVDFPELGLRKTFVGTRSSATFPSGAAVDERKA
jgi:uncharacterized cupin superfamily protein